MTAPAFQSPHDACLTDAAVIKLFGPTRARRELQGFEKRALLLGNPILDSFDDDEIVRTELVGFAPKKDLTHTIRMNRRLAPVLQAAFDRIKAEGLSYTLRREDIGGYYFRYVKNPSVTATIKERPEYAGLRVKYGKHFDGDWAALCAEQDRRNKAFEDKVPRAASGKLVAKKDLLSNHSFGSAVDINYGTNPFDAKKAFDMPLRIVEIMEGFGFYWGGYYHDYMHFEYLQASIAGVPDEAQPVVAFPYGRAGKRESPIKYYFLNEAGPGGFFPLGLRQNLHAGVHLDPPPGTDGPLVPITAAMPGYIVAARLMAPGAGGDNPTVQRVSDGRYLGFVLVRHELFPVQAQAGSGGANPQIHPLYSLYMHLTPPAWGAAELQGFDKAPWLSAFLGMQFGGVVDLDPASPEVGKTFWAKQRVAPDAAEIEVHGRNKPIAATRDGRLAALAKPAPEDVGQAIRAFKDGCIVTFDRPLFPVSSGEIMGFVSEASPPKGGGGDKGSRSGVRYLHWEIFSLAGASGGIQLLRSKADGMAATLKDVAEQRPNNFFDMPTPLDPSVPNEVKQVLGPTGMKVLDDIKTVEYGSNLRDYLNDGTSFVAGASKPFTCPLKLTLEDPHQLSKGGTLEVTYRRAGEQIGKEQLPVTGGQASVTLQVPVDADEIALWSAAFFLDTPDAAATADGRKARLASRIDLFNKVVADRWRNLVLEHIDEWTFDGLGQQLDARRNAGQLAWLMDGKDTNEAFENLKKELRPLAWWARKKTNDDPYGEVPVLGAETDQKTLFGPGDHLLPENASIVSMHPITALWLADILSEKGTVGLTKAWPPVTLRRSEQTMKPPFLGLLFRGTELRVGIDAVAVLVQHGYHDGDGSLDSAVTFWVKSGSGAPKVLGRADYVSGVAVLHSRLSVWGDVELSATAGATAQLEPAKKQDTKATLQKPGLFGTNFELGVVADKMRPRATGRFISHEACPVVLAGFIALDYWKVAKGGTAAFDSPPTPGKVAVPVLALRMSTDERTENGLKLNGEFVVGAAKAKTNPKVTPDFSLQSFRSHPKFKQVFAGDAFMLAMPLAQRLQALRGLCRAGGPKDKDLPIAVKRLERDGLSLLVVPASEKRADFDRLMSKVAELPASALFESNGDDTEGGVWLVYNPIEGAGTLAFDVDLGPALGQLAADALSAQGETLHARPRFLAPNGGHAMLFDKPLLDPATGTLVASEQDIRSACGGDLVELVADHNLPPVGRFEFGDIQVRMGADKLYTEVTLYGESARWRAGRPAFRLEVGGEKLTPGTVKGTTLVADWDLVDKRGNPRTERWGATLNFKAELQQPQKVTNPPPPVMLALEIKPKLIEVKHEVGPKMVLLTGRAAVMPTNIALSLDCERSDGAGGWVLESVATDAIQYKIPARKAPHFGNCDENGVFGAFVKKTAFNSQGPWRFTWHPRGQRHGDTVDVYGIPVTVVTSAELTAAEVQP
jgi:D-alanyl-D-alanine carboxypeptidase-like protein